MRDSGVLTRLDVAFSRDQADKVYVQDRMREQGAQLWAWLEEGAHFYVCGDANRMARDVDAALKEIVATHGGMSDEKRSRLCEPALRGKSAMHATFIDRQVDLKRRLKT